jgi:hypothetical protein
MKKTLFALLASVAIFSSCKKSSSGSTSTDTYLPNNVGTNWKYKVTTGGASTDVTYTVSSNTLAVDGITYKIITGSNGNEQYYAKSGSDYHSLIKVSGQNVHLIILKDDKNVNDTWTTTQTLTGLSIPGVPVTSATVNITYTMKEKGSTKVVEGVTYNNVIKVEAALSASAAGFPLSLGTIEYYFSKNIGIIENTANINNSTIGVNINDKYELKTYEIK